MSGQVDPDEVRSIHVRVENEGDFNISRAELRREAWLLADGQTTVTEWLDEHLQKGVR